ncbi:AHP1 Peroxiredoxin [uncultured Caudovirales phage]|uniref:AHP1 Peroxiredoxin n=1 Tax=uncultured Caudovirales phage TaxID=2100421 RepID=A0A6J5M6N5_9CAUD|nr:AHP1 Peroxiredoxin [uncultured Caudovirales phage]
MNNTLCATSDFDDEKFLPKVVPSVVFKTRVRNDSIEGPNPYCWEDVTSFDLFANKRVVLFSLPGAFTPTCSTYQLPGFEEKFAEFKALGIKDIYCVSVNDAFVMNAWAKQQKIKKVKVIPDGSCQFTNLMNMAVGKDNLGFGIRSWRYACVVNNGKIEKWFIEPGKCWDAENDPYGETAPENILNWLRSQVEV